MREGGLFCPRLKNHISCLNWKPQGNESCIDGIQSNDYTHGYFILVSSKSSEGLIKVWSPTLRAKCSQGPYPMNPIPVAPSTMRPTVLPASLSSLPSFSETRRTLAYMTLEIRSQESQRVLMQSHQVAPGEAKSWVSHWTGGISGALKTTNESQSICSRCYF